MTPAFVAARISLHPEGAQGLLGAIRWSLAC